jgi:hypothetical protein
MKHLKQGDNMNKHDNKVNIYIDAETRAAIDYLKSQGFTISGVVQQMLKQKASQIKQLEQNNG